MSRAPKRAKKPPTPQLYRNASAFAWMARIGYAARGIVFLIIAFFAGLAALGGGRSVGTIGALHSVLARPMGELLLWIVAFGLLCFAGWRFVDAIFDSDHYGSDMGGLARRAGLVGGGIFYLIVAGLAVTMIFGVRAGDGDGAARDWTAWLLAQPFGRWATVLVGIGIAASGIGQAAKPLRAEFRKQLALGAGPRTVVVAVGVLGYVARGVVFIIIGGFLVVAALRFNSGSVAGFAGALRALQQQPYGHVLLGITALGLFAFALFQWMQAAWRRLDLPKVHRLAAKVT
jgi:hypothetical protein